MTTDEEIRRKAEAEQLMAHPLMAEAFAVIENTVISELKRVDVGAQVAQRDLIVTLQLLGKLRQHIVTVIQTGKMAEMQKETWAQRMKKRLS